VLQKFPGTLQHPLSINPFLHLVELCPPLLTQETRIKEFVEEPESDGEADENLARSHLLIPLPRKEGPFHPIQDEDEGDGSENDAPALPVPHRRSMDMRASRSISESSDSSEPDTDHDGPPLPVRPRPATRVVPPPRSQESSQHEDEEPIVVDIRITTPIPLDRENHGRR